VINAAYHRLAHIWVVALSGNLVIILFIAFALLSSDMPENAPSVDRLQLAFSESRFEEILAQWGPVAVYQYRDTLWLDFVFPPLYAVFLASAVAVLTAPRPGAPLPLHRVWFVLPVIAVPFDYTENVLHLVILRDTDQLSAGLILLASLAAAVKWGLLAAALLAVIYFFIRRALSRAVVTT